MKIRKFTRSLSCNYIAVSSVDVNHLILHYLLQVSLPCDKEWTIAKLLVWIKDNLIKERPELLIQGDSVRPGILVLVNDSDWELCGQLDYIIENSDTIVFISTLHGG